MSTSCQLRSRAMSPRRSAKASRVKMIPASVPPLSMSTTLRPWPARTAPSFTPLIGICELSSVSSSADGRTLPRENRM